VEELTALFKKYGVKIAYLFGSQKEAGAAFLSGKAVEVDGDSDLDIGLVFERLPEKTFSVYGELYADLCLLFEPFVIDPVFIQETESFLQYEAITGELIYCEDEIFLDNYEEMVMKKASDLKFKKVEFEKDFLEAVRNGYFEIEDYKKSIKNPRD